MSVNSNQKNTEQISPVERKTTEVREIKDPWIVVFLIKAVVKLVMVAAIIPSMYFTCGLLCTPLVLLWDIYEYLQFGNYDRISGLGRLQEILKEDYWTMWIGSPTQWLGVHKIVVLILSAPASIALFVGVIATGVLLGVCFFLAQTLDDHVSN